MDVKGIHLLIDLYGCPAEILDDAPHIEAVAREIAGRIQAEVLNASCHRLSPQGVILVLALRQSHLSIHTWPEAGYGAVDLFFYMPDPVKVSSLAEVLRERFGAARFEECTLKRGAGLSGKTAMSYRSWP